MSTVLEVLFWASVGLILYTHAGYPLLLWTIARLGRTRVERSDGHGLPHVS
ncbi:MAG: hypothetical protein QOD53_1442, partial [Thermoleophilaceae bacterium]|nr:hypothetical protein [Thermoleophilaceae bacterium]